MHTLQIIPECNFVLLSPFLIMCTDFSKEKICGWEKGGVGGGRERRRKTSAGKTQTPEVVHR